MRFKHTIKQTITAAIHSTAVVSGCMTMKCFVLKLLRNGMDFRMHIVRLKRKTFQLKYKQQL